MTLTTLEEAFAGMALNMFEDTCSVKHGSASGGVISQTVDHTEVPCLVRATGAGGNIDAIRQAQRYRVTMPVNIDGSLNAVKVTSRIIVDARGSYPERKYQVHSIQQATASVSAICTIET